MSALARFASRLEAVSSPGLVVVCAALGAACSEARTGPTMASASQAGNASGIGGSESAGRSGASAGTSGAGGSPDADGGSGGTAGTAQLNQSSVTISGRFPANGAEVCSDAPLRLSFSAPVTVGTSGKIQVFKASDPSTPVDAIDVAVSSIRDTLSGRPFYKIRPVFIEGNDALVYLKNKALAEASRYFVTVDAGAFVDAENRPLAAFGGPADWQFDTRAPAPLSATQLTVSREGAGDFCSVQGAVDFLPMGNLTPTTITLKKGTYHEIVYIAAKHNITFHGEDRKQSIIAYPNNDALQMKLGTAFRALVEAEGSNGLVFENLTLHNTTPQGGSQAEALRLEPSDKSILRDSDFISLQDTLLLSGRVYVTNSYVEGNVDFIWGKGTAYFDKSEIKTVGRPGYLVQSRNTTNSGYVFVDSVLSTEGTSALGTMLARIEADRFPNSQVAFVNCKMGPHIAAKGWLVTNSLAASTAGLDLSKLRFWEYQSSDLGGAPLDVSLRDPASRQISEAEAAQLRDKASVLAGWTPTP